MRSLLFLAPFVLLACSSDDNNNTPTTVPDSGTPTSDSGTPTDSGTPPDAGSDTGTNTGPKLVTGDGYAVVYTDNSTYDARPSVTGTFDANGFMTGYATKNPDEAPLIGAATNDGAKTDGVAAVGRWIGGPLAGKFYSDSGKTYAADDAFHWAIAKASPEATVPAVGTSYELDLADPATQQGQSAAGHVTAFTMSFAAGSGTDITINATLTHDVNGGGTVTKASAFIAPATGFPAQLRSNDGELVYAGLFGGASAERVVVAISKPVHAALSLKKK